MRNRRHLALELAPSLDLDLLQRRVLRGAAHKSFFCFFLTRQKESPSGRTKAHGLRHGRIGGNAEQKGSKARTTHPQTVSKLHRFHLASPNNQCYNKQTSKPDSRVYKAKACPRGKSGLHRARITGNARRRRLQEKCNRDIPPGGNCRPVRVEKWGKSPLAGWEQSGPVNSIRSNTVGGQAQCAKVSPTVLGRWLEPSGNAGPRQMTVQYRTRLIGLLV